MWSRQESNLYQKFRKLLFYPLNYVTILFFLYSCAKVGTITGGDSDNFSSFVTYEYPPNYSTNFNSKFITIKFNEFVKFSKNFNNNLAFQPLIKNVPKFLEINKGIKIVFNENLKPNTTYSLDLSNLIVDYSEGNPLKHYEYVFSTGRFIDTNYIYGSIKRFDKTKDYKNTFALLYNNNDSDSSVFKNIPNYISNIDTSGNFIFKYIKKNKYKIFIINDLNKNFLYDENKEDIGFINNLVSSEKQNYYYDFDTLHFSKKIFKLNEVKIIDKTLTIKDTFILFNENKYKFIVKNYANLFYGKSFVLIENLHDSVKIKFLNKKLNLNKISIDYIKSKDSLFIWNLNNYKDTLKFIFKFNNQIDSVSILPKNFIKKFDINNYLSNKIYTNFKSNSIYKEVKLNNYFDILTKKIKTKSNSFYVGEKIQENLKLSDSLIINFNAPWHIIDSSKINLFSFIDSSMKKTTFFNFIDTSFSINDTTSFNLYMENLLKLKKVITSNLDTLLFQDSNVIIKNKILLDKNEIIKNDNEVKDTLNNKSSVDNLNNNSLDSINFNNKVNKNINNKSFFSQDSLLNNLSNKKLNQNNEIKISIENFKKSNKYLYKKEEIQKFNFYFKNNFKLKTLNNENKFLYYSLFIDSIKLNTNYLLKFDSCAIENIYKNCNDSMTISFSTIKEETFADINILINNNSNFQDSINYILLIGNLISKDFKSIYSNNQFIFNKNLSIKNLPVGKYKIRIIEDLDNNYVWSNGDFLKRKLPENFYDLPDDIIVEKDYETDHIINFQK